MSDPIALESLLVQAIHSETIDEFAEVLRYTYRHIRRHSRRGSFDI